MNVLRIVELVIMITQNVLHACQITALWLIMKEKGQMNVIHVKKTAVIAHLTTLGALIVAHRKDLLWERMANIQTSVNRVQTTVIHALMILKIAVFAMKTLDLFVMKTIIVQDNAQCVTLIIVQIATMILHFALLVIMKTVTVMLLDQMDYQMVYVHLVQVTVQCVKILRIALIVMLALVTLEMSKDVTQVNAKHVLKIVHFVARVSLNATHVNVALGLKEMKMESVLESVFHALQIA